MNTILRMIGCLLVITLCTQLLPSIVMAEEQRPEITHHPVKVEMEPAREIPVVMESRVNWWYVLLGVVIVAGIGVAAGSGGGGSGGTPPQNGNANFTW